MTTPHRFGSAPRSQAGFTLIEILIALTVLVVGLVGILALFPVGLHSSRSAIEDSTSSILAESIKSSIIASFRLAATGQDIDYYHDGVDIGFQFSLPADSAAANDIWVPVSVESGRFVIAVGQDNGLEFELPDPGEDATNKKRKIVPYRQYSYKFQVRKKDDLGVDNLYLIVMYIYRNYQDSKAGSGKNQGNSDDDQNEPINVFGTMVASN
jgi:prepilin-type N-terminal cleavage/methylation domain-containing protein